MQLEFPIRLPETPPWPGVKLLHPDKRVQEVVSQRAIKDTRIRHPSANLLKRGTQHFSYDSDSRLHCAGSGAGSCDQVVFGYDGFGAKVYEDAPGSRQIFLGDLFRWNATDRTSVVYVFAFGQRIGQITYPVTVLRSAWLPTALGPRLDVPGILEFFYFLAFASLLVLAASGGAVLVRQQPTRTLVSLVVVMSLPTLGLDCYGDSSTRPAYRWFYHNHVGSVVLQVTEDSTVESRRTFHPFGEVALESAGSGSQALFFTGQASEAITGLYDFKARWYDPEIGRFLSPDPILLPLDPQSHNPYSYVRNDPVNLRDPSGLFFEDDDDWDLGLELTIIGRGDDRDDDEPDYWDDDWDDDWDPYDDDWDPYENDDGLDDWEFNNSFDDSAASATSQSGGFGLGDAAQLGVEVFVPFGGAATALGREDYGGAALEAGIEIGATAVGALTGGTGYLAVKGFRAARAARGVYVANSRAIRSGAYDAVLRGGDPTKVAEIAVDARNALKLQARQGLPGPLQRVLGARNTRRYGNPAGPSAGDLLSGADPIDVIESSGRTNPLLNSILGVP